MPAVNIIKLNVAPCCSSPTDTWLLTTPTVLFDLRQSNTIETKNHTPSDIYISKYNEIQNLYLQYIPVLQNNHTATAFVQKSHIITLLLPGGWRKKSAIAG